MERNITTRETSKFCVGLRYDAIPGWVAYTTYIANLLTAIQSLDQEIEIAVVVNRSGKRPIPFVHLIDREVQLPTPFFLSSLPGGMTGKVFQKA